MLNTKYTGKLELLGSGIYTSNFVSRRSLIKIGDKKIKNVMTSDYLDSFLQSEVDDENDSSLSVGWIMFYRWLLALKHEGHTERQGLFMFCCGMLTHLIVMALAAGLGGAIIAELVSPGLGALVASAVGIFWLITSVINVKAWLMPKL